MWARLKGQAASHPDATVLMWSASILAGRKRSPLAACLACTVRADETGVGDTRRGLCCSVIPLAPQRFGEQAPPSVWTKKDLFEPQRSPARQSPTRPAGDEPVSAIVSGSYDGPESGQAIARSVLLIIDPAEPPVGD
jgi:hypothetical protein